MKTIKFINVFLLLFLMSSCLDRRTPIDALPQSANPADTPTLIEPSDDPTANSSEDISASIVTEIKESFEANMEPDGYQFGKKSLNNLFFKIDRVKIQAEDSCKDYTEDVSSCNVKISVKKTSNTRPLFVVKYRESASCPEGEKAIPVRRIITLADELLPNMSNFANFNTSGGKAAFTTIYSLSAKLCETSLTPNSLLCDIIKRDKLYKDNVKIFAWNKRILDIIFKKPVLYVCSKSIIDKSFQSSTDANDRTAYSVATLKLELSYGKF